MVILECPYESIDSPETQALFSRMAALKITGYRPNYGYGVLPVDTSDFIATHLLICRETPDGWLPVTGCRTITRSRSEKHGLVFPGLTLVRSAGSKDHEKAVERWMWECRKDREELSYASSWTVDPSVGRQDKETRALLRDLFEAIHVLYHTESGLKRVLVGGTLRFKTDQVFASWGHQRLQWEGKELGNIQVPTLLGEDVAVMTLDGFNEETLKRVERWRSVWEQRLVIGSKAADGDLAALKVA